MSSQTYGGQAVIEGVMIRGARSMAIAVRRPDGSIVVRTERLTSLLTGPLRRVPLLRGVLVLWETLTLGIRALTWSSAIAADEVDEDGEAAPLGASGWLLLILMLMVALAIFFAGPLVATAWLQGQLPNTAVVAVEGVLRLGLLVGYIWLIGRSADVRRVFQYHGAEHMTIHAFERGRELQVQAIRRFEKEHPRCGTSFLLTVAVIATFVFVLVGSEPLWWRFASRLVLIPGIAALAYEAIRFGGFHLENPVVRLLFSGNLALQRLTTKVPDDEQIQVAVASLQAAVAADNETTAATGTRDVP